MNAKKQTFAKMQQAVECHQKGQLSEAEQFYQDVLSIEPCHADALRFLGSLYVQLNKADEAIEYFEKALLIEPQNTELLNNLGVALYSQGKPHEALLSYKKALVINPAYVDALNNIGNVYYESGKFDDAAASLARAVQLNPRNPATHVSLGHVLRNQRKVAEAITHYQQAMQFWPDNIDLLTHLGNLLRQSGRSEEALAIYQRLVDLKPHDANTRLNLGTLFHDVGKAKQALEQYEEILKRQPTHRDALICRAGILLETDKPSEARIDYDLCLSLYPNSADALLGKSLTLLMEGQFSEGWGLYEKRFEHKPLRTSLLFRTSRWDGRPLDGQRLLIWGEQGLGDVLQFIRYASLCKERGGTILVLCREPLHRLLQNCPYIDSVVASATDSDFDYQIPVMSLPYVFGTTVATIPQNIPYLYVSTDARNKWSRRIGDEKKFKVGLAWSGNPRKNQIDAHITDRQRSISLDNLKLLFDFQQCRFYSLQKGEAANERTALGLDHALNDYMPEADDLMDTAAIIEQLDLVITVDTSIAHLAGGLGKPVWVLSRLGGCWRWLRNQEANPWYPTARIFGQQSSDDWISCIDNIYQALNVKLMSLSHE